MLRGLQDRYRRLHWSRRWVYPVEYATFMTLFMALVNPPKSRTLLGYVIMGSIMFPLFAAGMSWMQRTTRWQAGWSLSLDDRIRVVRAVGAGESPDDPRLAEAVLDKTERNRRVLERELGFWWLPLALSLVGAALAVSATREGHVVQMVAWWALTAALVGIGVRYKRRVIAGLDKLNRAQAAALEVARRAAPVGDG